MTANDMRKALEILLDHGLTDSASYEIEGIIQEMEKQPKITTDIIYSRDLNEYTVRLFVDGVRDKEASYFTDDKQDAQTTAAAMVRDYKGGK